MNQRAVDVEWLRLRWGRWSRVFGGAGGTLGGGLLARYADPARVYHDVRHLRGVLETVDELLTAAADGRASPVDQDTVELAAWFHDAVYDVGGTGNEAASATLASETLAPYLSAERCAEVVRLVLLTRDHAVGAGDSNGALLCDADLAVLAGTDAGYDEYVRRVRAEYAHVGDADFRTGRAAVLQALLDLPALFHTDHGVANWEAPARANVRRELASLR